MPIMISITAASIITMPMASRSVNASLKMVIPIITAVTGSRAPIIAAGVEPTSWMAIVIITNDNTVGNSARIRA